MRWSRTPCNGLCYAPLAVAAAVSVLGLPACLHFADFLTNDPGANLAATMLARMGQRPNLDFGYPHGPLVLALQEWALDAIRKGPYAMMVLTIVGTLLFGWGASWGIRRLRLPLLPGALLCIATIIAGLTDPPVYTLEPAALLWAIVTFAGDNRAAALTWCMVAALLKPSMGIVLGALLVGEALVHASRADQPWAVVRQMFVWPLLAALGLCGLLILHFGGRGFMRLALPLAGARDYRLSHFSFFSAGGNPFIVPGARLGLYLGTPVTAWAVACIALAAALAFLRPRGAEAWSRWFAAAACGLGTLAFVCGFYGYQFSYAYYCTLPLLGLALLPWERLSSGLLAEISLMFLTALAALGTFSASRNCIRLWLFSRPSVVTADLWATPAEAAEWLNFARANPPSSRPLLLDIGEIEAIFPQYGPPWHGYLYPGVITTHESADLVTRVRNARCVAFDPSIIESPPAVALSPATVAAITARRPHVPGEIFDTYGCR